MAHRLTKTEKEVLDKSAELWNAYIALPENGNDDVDDFRFHLHALQRIIMSRPTHRAMQQELEDARRTNNR